MSTPTIETYRKLAEHGVRLIRKADGQACSVHPSQHTNLLRLAHTNGTYLDRPDASLALWWTPKQVAEHFDVELERGQVWWQAPRIAPADACTIIILAVESGVVLFRQLNTFEQSPTLEASRFRQCFPGFSGIEGLFGSDQAKVDMWLDKREDNKQLERLSVGDRVRKRSDPARAGNYDDGQYLDVVKGRNGSVGSHRPVISTAQITVNGQALAEIIAASEAAPQPAFEMAQSVRVRVTDELGTISAIGLTKHGGYDVDLTDGSSRWFSADELAAEVPIDETASDAAAPTPEPAPLIPNLKEVPQIPRALQNIVDRLESDCPDWISDSIVPAVLIASVGRMRDRARAALDLMQSGMLKDASFDKVLRYGCKVISECNVTLASGMTSSGLIATGPALLEHCESHCYRAHLVLVARRQPGAAPPLPTTPKEPGVVIDNNFWQDGDIDWCKGALPR